MKSNYRDGETVGSQYVKAQSNSVQGLTIGDIGSDMVLGLVEDLNKCIEGNPFNGEDFFINVVEERDLQMKNTIKRRMFVSQYRPYPEDNTLVFRVSQKENRVTYCWDIPHHSELPNILSNNYLYDKEYVRRISEWLQNDLTNFGFVKVSMNSSQVEGYDEERIQIYKKNYEMYCKSIGMDDKAVATEMRYGFFWLPNPHYVDRDLFPSKPKVSLIGI